MLRRRPDDYHGVYLRYRIDDAGAAKQSLRGIFRGRTNPPLPGPDEIWPGEFILGHQDESGKLPDAPVPDVLGRNGSYLAFRQSHGDVAAFRRYPRDHAKSPEHEELIGAKMIGRRRSGAALALSPDKDDPDLAADPASRSAADSPC